MQGADGILKIDLYHVCPQETEKTSATRFQFECVCLMEFVKYPDIYTGCLEIFTFKNSDLLSQNYLQPYTFSHYDSFVLSNEFR